MTKKTGNGIGADGAKAISGMLQVNTTLVSLNVARNGDDMERERQETKQVLIDR